MAEKRRRTGLVVLKWGLILGLLGAAVAAATLATLFWVFGHDPDLPRIDSLKDYQPKQVIRLLSADGQPIGEVFEERRTVVPIAEIAPVMIQALIDAEDADFRTHEGLSYVGMLRALWVNFRSGRTRQGASTLTQQVVKTFMLRPERTLRRKIQEVILARRLERALSKDEILTLYLNQVYFGHGRYGVEEAALFFFGKRARELDVAEAALLAGLVQSPERLSPRKHPDEAKRRQTYVLEQMVKRGHLDEAEAKRLIAAPIRLVPEPVTGTAPEIEELVRAELVRRYGERGIYRAGGTVQTTIDSRLEAAARTALESGLRALDERQGYRKPLAHLAAAKVPKKLKDLGRDLPAKLAAGASYEAVVTAISDEKGEMTVNLGGRSGTVLLAGKADERYNPEGKKPSERFAPNDVVRVRAVPELAVKEGDAPLALAQGPQAALVAIDPRTRHVVALVGGYGFTAGQFDRALHSRRQPGSAFKPFVYAAALDSGRYTPASVVVDAPEVYDLWKPKNYKNEAFRGPVRLRQALAASINTVSIRLLSDLGPARVVELAHAMGIVSELPAELSLALGSGGVTPLEITNAYATFAAEGRRAAPVFFTRVGGEAIAPEPAVQVLRPEIAYLTTSLMESVVREGTAQAAKKLRRAIAGKTGTSNDERDAWFIGFHPGLVVGVWVGFDEPRSLGRGEAGGKAALPIWIELVGHALELEPALPFRQPPGVVVARIDPASGKLAAPTQADALDEFFLEGTAPTETAPAPGEVTPGSFLIDDEEGGSETPDAGAR